MYLVANIDFLRNALIYNYMEAGFCDKHWICDVLVNGFVGYYEEPPERIVRDVEELYRVKFEGYKVEVDEWRDQDYVWYYFSGEEELEGIQYDAQSCWMTDPEDLGEIVQKLPEDLRVTI